MSPGVSAGVSARVSAGVPAGGSPGEVSGGGGGLLGSPGGFRGVSGVCRGLGCWVQGFRGSGVKGLRVVGSGFQTTVERKEGKEKSLKSNPNRSNE